MPISIAILITIAGSTLMGIGLVFQKKQAAEMPRLDKNSREAARAFAKNKAWLAGVAGTTIGFCLYAWAAKIAPIAIVHTLLGLGLVVIALLSIFYLHEKLTAIEWAGIGVALLGMMLLAKSVTEKDHGVVVETWVLIKITAVIVFLVTLTYICRRWIGKKKIDPGWVYAIIAGLFIGLGALYLKAAWNAYDAGHVALARFFVPFIAFFFIGGLAVMQSGFQHGSAIVVVALNSVINKTVAFSGAMITLGEYLPEDPVLAAMRVAGFLLILIGTTALSRFGRK